MPMTLNLVGNKTGAEIVSPAHTMTQMAGFHMSSSFQEDFISCFEKLKSHYNAAVASI